MRRLSTAALLALPLLLTTTAGTTTANPNSCSYGYGCGGRCLNLFSGIHQHGPLFNYGPYYGYYPFKPYGPWDAYLRYDPFFYGDPYADSGGGNVYGRNPHLHGLGHLRGLLHHGGLHKHGGGLFHHDGCKHCGFWHASWLHGGWFRGHNWVHGGGLFHKHKHDCTSCGGVAQVTTPAPSGDAVARLSGVGSSSQSSVFYEATPTLNPALEVVPAGYRR
jgi:hypothetical protein